MHIVQRGSAEFIWISIPLCQRGARGSIASTGRPSLGQHCEQAVKVPLRRDLILSSTFEPIGSSLPAQRNWPALASPPAGLGLEHAGKRHSAIQATPLLGKMPLSEVEPVAADQERAAAVAPGAAAGPVVDVAGIDISHAVGACDVAGAPRLPAYRASSSLDETP